MAKNYTYTMLVQLLLILVLLVFVSGIVLGQGGPSECVDKRKLTPLMFLSNINNDKETLFLLPKLHLISSYKLFFLHNLCQHGFRKTARQSVVQGHKHWMGTKKRVSVTLAGIYILPFVQL